MTDRATIMLVEDDEELSEVMQYNLHHAGYRVVPVLDGGQAIADLEHQRPDLVLLDLMLPGADGWEVCDFMASREPLSGIPVVIFTARSAREDYDRARQYDNFAGYFVKPYATRDVMRHIEKVLARG